MGSDGELGAAPPRSGGAARDSESTDIAAVDGARALLSAWSQGANDMNVFVLCTGRCGSLTFARARRFIENYTSAHGSDPQMRLDYPDDHIEVDNRLPWLLGRLDEAYPDAYFVHLLRNLEDTVRSFVERGSNRRTSPLHGFMFALKQGKADSPKATAEELVDTINANIRHYLQRRPHVTIQIEDPQAGFTRMWREIGGVGDRSAALAALTECHNRGKRK